MRSIGIFLSITLICTATLPNMGNAQVSSLDTGLGDSYYYTDHFEIIIDTPISNVWPHILEMGSWMPWMAETNSASSAVAEGDLINLYGDFYVEVVKVIPESMVLLVNLPNSQEDEGMQGVAMVTAKESNNGKTVVSIFMSRIYYWFNSGDNQQRAARESKEFANTRRVTFKDNFLTRLKELAEG